MKKLISGLVVAVMLLGCGGASSNTTTNTETTQNADNSGKLSSTTIHTVNGDEVRIVADTINRTDVKLNADLVYMEVEGMPCVMFYMGNSKNGFTCDWDYWTGKRNADYEDDYSELKKQKENTISKRKLSRAELREQQN